MATNIAKTIDPKTLLGSVKKMVAPWDEGKREDVIHIVGRTDAVETGEGTHGPWVRFVGNFEAVNAITGELTVSNKCYLPDPYEGLTYSALQNADGGSVEIAVTIAVQKEEALPTGYRYHVKSLQDIKPADDLNHLRGLMPPVTPKAIEAPKEETPAAPEKAAKK
jgi:hypothetical protein